MAAIEIDGVQKVFDGMERAAVAEVSLTVADGECLVLVGPSGCGKSTLLRMIAGIERVSGGQIRIDGADVTDREARDRDIAMVFQNYALYPHMTVEENLHFGLKIRKMPKAERNKRVEAVAQMLRLDELVRRKPGQLSGGQRQRVAMGRAMVREPKALLMDEPLSNLDAKLRVLMRAELARLHGRVGTTTIYVTHDQTEAMTLGDRVAVISDGVLQQVAPPDELYSSPANLFVASFIGSPSINVAEGVVRDGRLVFAGVELPIPPVDLGGRTRVLVGVRPADLNPFDKSGAGAVPLRATVEVAEHLGAEMHVLFPVVGPASHAGTEVSGDQGHEREGVLLADDGSSLFTAVLPAVGSVGPGDRLDLGIDPELLMFFDPETGGSLQRVSSTAGASSR
ncbi:MAG: ATP-binding cassette domain-containing protein [Actinobacteria bacterium]|nr:ATP-binding cassette domain-containing protein [Actinomycetota bacterium]